MAIPPVYRVGTASINVGETAVTGQGTTWLTSGIREGDLFWAAGLVVRIAAVNSNTSMTLAHAWPGANRAAAAYEIHYTEDGARVYAATQEMLRALGANAVVPLAGLTPAANKMPYYTGPGTAALADLTALGRALLDDPDAATMRATLGLAGNDIAREAATTFGTYVSSGQDLNNLVVGDRGLYGTSGMINAPPLSGVQFWYVTNQRMYVGGAVLQVAVGYWASTAPSSTPVWIREKNASGVWGPWGRLLTSDAIVGTISTDGTNRSGAIIERGSNANGEYVRFADGTQICTLREGALALAVTSAVGAMYRDSTLGGWTFPAAFSAAPVGIFSVMSTFLVGLSTGATTTSMTRAVLGAATYTGNILACGLAIGRWF